MNKYKINEIYYTIQGEGRYVGMSVIIIRLAGCNLSCEYCDTEFDSFSEMTLEQIAAACKEESHNCANLLITGGEPLLQIDDEFVDYFHSIGYGMLLETSGTVKEKYDRELEWVTVSPKSPQLKYSGRVDELRIPVKAGSSIEKFINIDATIYYLSPIFDGDNINQNNLAYALSLIKNDPKLNLSLQTHKLIGVR